MHWRSGETSALGVFVMGRTRREKFRPTPLVRIRWWELAAAVRILKFQWSSSIFVRASMAGARGG
jgi:hypothetical protein